MRNLWVPLVVADAAASRRFYGTLLGLSQVDGWDTEDGEQGAVFAVDGPGHIEVVQVAPGSREPPPPVVALELPDRAGVDALRARLVAAGSRPGQATVHPRGYYGFVADDPDGHPILLWSEKGR